MSFDHIEPVIMERLNASDISFESITLRNDSHLHAGHSGAKTGGHFHLDLISNDFENKNRVQRHQMIYQLFGDLMQNGIHALSLNTKTSEESI